MEGQACKSGRPRDLGIPLFVVVAGVAVALWGLLGSSVPAGGGRLALADALLALLLALFTAVAAHEAGHLLAGLLVGLRPVLVAVGPLHLAFTNVGLRARLDWPIAPGLTLCLPTRERHHRRMAILLCAGGPLAGLLLAASALAVNARLGAAQPTASAARAWASLYLEATAALSAIATVASLLPLGMKGALLNDGARIGMLVRGGARARRWCALTALEAAAMRGLRPREWPEAVLAEATGTATGTVEDWAALLAAYHVLLDRGEVARAGSLLDRALVAGDHLPLALRGSSYHEAAFYTALYRHDAEAARAYLDQAPVAPDWLVSRRSALRAEAAVLLAEGEHLRAAAAAKQGLAAVDRAWDRGRAQAEREWLLEILAAAQGKESSS